MASTIVVHRMQATTGSQWRSWRREVTWEHLGRLKMRRTSAFWINILSECTHWGNTAAYGSWPHWAAEHPPVEQFSSFSVPSLPLAGTTPLRQTQTQAHYRVWRESCVKNCLTGHNLSEVHLSTPTSLRTVQVICQGMNLHRITLAQLRTRVHLTNECTSTFRRFLTATLTLRGVQEGLGYFASLHYN